MSLKNLLAVKDSVWVVLFSLTLSLVVLQLLVSSALAGRGEELASYEGKIDLLTRKNKVLEEELAQKASIGYIASESARLGLQKPSSIIYIDLPLPVALRKDDLLQETPRLR